MFTRQLLKMSNRNFHKTGNLCLNPAKVEEVKIPVPWGHIAGEWWGDRTTEPVVAVHGWMDNAGSWRPLLELLPEKYGPVLALDMPGRGHSSHYPQFHDYSFVDFAELLRIVQQWLNVPSLTLIGHDAGAVASLQFAVAYPDVVRAFLAIDIIVCAYGDLAVRADAMSKVVDRKVEMGMRQGNRPLKAEDARDVWVAASNGSLTAASVDLLMRRGVHTLSDGRVEFSRDRRLQIDTLESLSPAQALRFANSVSCPMEVIWFKGTPIFPGGLKAIPTLLDCLRKSLSHFVLHELHGKHHHHMDNPAEIIPIISDFIKNFHISVELSKSTL